MMADVDVEANIELREANTPTLRTSTSQDVVKRLRTPVKIVLLGVILLSVLLPFLAKIQGFEYLEETATAVKEATVLLTGTVEERRLWGHGNTTSSKD